MTSFPGRSARRTSALSVLAAALLFLPAAQALEEQRGEEAAIKACNKRRIVLVARIKLMQKNPKGDDLRCSLTKTWARSTIKKADSHKLSWAFGDAQCTANIDLSRARLVAALTEDQERKLRVPPHTVNCVVEQDGKLQKVTATLSPKIYFKDGKAEKIWVNLTNVEGPAGIKATLQTAAQLADTLGLFHRRMVKSVNRYVERHCSRDLPAAGFHHSTQSERKA